MAASRRDPTIPLPHGWGRAEIGPDTGGAGPRSYTHEGNLLRWFPADDGYRLRACDIESSGSATGWMARRFDLGNEEFLARWVCTEVLAKLHGIPIVHWLKTRGLFRQELEPKACRLFSLGGDGQLLYLREARWAGHVAFGRMDPIDPPSASDGR